MGIKYAKDNEIRVCYTRKDDPQKRPLFDEIQPTLIELYAEHLMKVKAATGLKDERALQAVGFTIWTMTWDAVNTCGDYVSKNYLDFSDPVTGLNHLDTYKETNLALKQWLFIGQTVALGIGSEITQEDVVAIMKSGEVTLGEKGFAGVTDHRLLAEMVILRHQMNTEKVTKAKGNKKMKELEAKMVPLAMDF